MILIEGMAINRVKRHRCVVNAMQRQQAKQPIRNSKWYVDCHCGPICHCQHAYSFRMLQPRISFASSVVKLFCARPVKNSKKASVTFWSLVYSVVFVGCPNMPKTSTAKPSRIVFLVCVCEKVCVCVSKSHHGLHSTSRLDRTSRQVTNMIILFPIT